MLSQNLCIHRIGCQINLPRPRHHTRIHKYLPEKPRVLESSKYASELLRSQLDLSRNAVPKPHEECVIFQWLYLDNIPIQSDNPSI